MRTAADFDRLYATENPWKLGHFNVRDRNLARLVRPMVLGKTVLELGCGEGRLTTRLLSRASKVISIDISPVAVSRAQARQISNATFFACDFLDVSFAGHDVVLALECLYYLSPEERGHFFSKLAREHRGKLIAFSGPIIDGYFDHDDLIVKTRAAGFRLIGWHNLSIYWKPFTSRVIANIAKLPFCAALADALPDRLVYQRLYVFRASIA